MSGGYWRNLSCPLRLARRREGTRSVILPAVGRTSAEPGAGRRAHVALLALAFVHAACAANHVDAARSALRTNDLHTARTLLEADRERYPDSMDVRLTLGEVYYRSARDALDWDDNQAGYLAYLEKSLNELVRAAELEPKSPQPLFYLAMIDLYRGDIKAAQQGFRDTRKLGFGPIGDTNLAESYVYAGNLNEAFRWNEAGRQAGAGLGPVTYNEMLIAWSSGDLAAAHKSFEVLRVQYPEEIREFNVASVPGTPRSFEEFAGYCCATPACGPYLEKSCEALKLPVKHREVSKETLLEELRVKMEAQRKLQEIYKQRKELEIEAKPEEPAK